MSHESLIETARRRIASLGNIESAPPREPAPVPLGAAFPHLGGWPHAGANPPAHVGGTVHDSRAG